MGRLVPEDFPLATLDDAERAVVETFRDGLTDSWLILPDVGLHKQIDHQLDIVLVHQQYGVIDVEVKGHTRIEVRDGVFYSQGSRMERQPFEQAKSNAFALRSELRALGGDLTHVNVEYAVALPNAKSVSGRLPPAVDPTQVLTAPLLDEPRDAIEDLAVHRFGGAMTAEAVEAIVGHLRPHALIEWDPEALLRRARNRLDETCRLQVAAMETLDANPRVYVTGRAGTGKTRLAKGWAQRAWLDDQRVLLTCYNDPLAWELQERLSLDERIVVGAFLRVALALDGMPRLTVPEHADQAWWDDVAIPHIRSGWDQVTQRFDTIVVDEGQDFDPIWLEQLAGLLAPDGRLLVVGDDAQVLYDRGFRPPTPADGWTVGELVINCRNVHPVGSLLRRRLDGAQSPAVGPEGLGVSWEAAEDVDSVAVEVEAALVQRLESDERDPMSMVVATHTTSVRDRLRAELDLVPWEQRGARVACENIHRIKGVEVDTVILAVPTADVADALLYVGISRAVSELVVVGPEALADHLGLT